LWLATIWLQGRVFIAGKSPMWNDLDEEQAARRQREGVKNKFCRFVARPTEIKRCFQAACTLVGISTITVLALLPSGATAQRHDVAPEETIQARQALYAAGLGIRPPPDTEVRPLQSLPVAPLPLLLLPTTVAPPVVNDNAQAGIRTVVLNLRQLGASGPLTMRGPNELQSVQFGIRADEVVTSAQLTLTGATSPMLIPELSRVAVTLNELSVGTVPVNRERPEYQLTVPINPMFFRSNTNRLNFRFTGRYSRGCNDPMSGLLWASISDASTLTLRLEHLPAQRMLSRLPLPFFDPRERTQLVLPFVLPISPSDDALKAAAVVASWLGKQAAYREARFPVLAQPPHAGNAMMFVTGDDPALKGFNLPPITGPTLAMLANPNDTFGSLLVVAGRTPEETRTAALALVVGTQALGDMPIAVVGVPEVARRKPYDAPNWIPTDRPVRLGEAVDQPLLHSIGYTGLIRVPFRTAPDFFSWRNQPFRLNLHIHAPPGSIDDLAQSRLDVSVNDVFLSSLPLAQPGSQDTYLTRLFGHENTAPDTQVDLPPYNVFSQNDLQLYFDARPMARTNCVDTRNSLLMSVDPDSTIDLSRGYRVSRLPDLAFFAGSGFPFTRMADLSDTAVVLPNQPGDVEISGFLTLMGRIGAITGYPVTGLAVVRPDNVASVASRDLLMMGTLEHLGDVGGLLVKSPVQKVGNQVVVSLSAESTSAHRLAWSTQQSDRTRRAGKMVANLGDDWGALLGLESPLHAGRSLVALLGSTPQAMERVVVALGDPAQASLINGDLTLVTGERAASYRVGPTFTFGDLPFWLWPSWLLGNQIWGFAKLILLGSAILAFVFYRMIQRLRHPPRSFTRSAP
jgi:hypothetical protein